MTASSRAGHAAKLAEHHKRQNTIQPASSLLLAFCHWPLRAMARLARASTEEFIDLCNSIAHGTSIAGTTWAVSSFSVYWRQRITVCRRRGSARTAQRCLLTNCHARSGGNLADLNNFVNTQLFSFFFFVLVCVCPPSLFSSSSFPFFSFSSPSFLYLIVLDSPLNLHLFLAIFSSSLLLLK